MITHYYEDADALLVGLTALIPPSRQDSFSWKAQVSKATSETKLVFLHILISFRCCQK